MKILVVHASAGAGHKKAAEAVYNGLKENPSYNTTLIDALDHSSFIFKKSYSKAYFFLISKLPWLWAASFTVMDQGFFYPILKILRRINNSLNVKKLEKFIIDEKFDYVVTTHFMPVEVISAMKRKGLTNTKLITVVTDYDVHRIWLGSDVDIYCVATPWTKEKLTRMGVPGDKIKVTGIPTDKKFSEPKIISELKETLGVKGNILTVLMATGSFGIGPIEEAIKAVKGVQIIVVCGHNKNLYETLNRKQYQHVKVCGLVDNMHELMAVSDVMVTKPGGLSISEALICGLPMIFFSAIPGQETNNIMVLSKFGIGAKGFKIENIVEELEKFKNSPDELLKARQKTQHLARPNAVNDIIGLIV